jgi:hypothetical protein
MRVSKGHPVANWLHVDAGIYSHSLDHVLRDRDEQLKIDPQASGLPPASVEWFWQEQLPKLCCKPEILNQVEQRKAELAAKRDALAERVARAEREIAAERDELDSELASLNQAIRS